MHDSNGRYINPNAALMHLLDNKNQQVPGHNYQSPSLKLKSKTAKESSSIERPKSNKMRYVGKISSNAFNALRLKWNNAPY